MNGGGILKVQEYLLRKLVKLNEQIIKSYKKTAEEIGRLPAATDAGKLDICVSICRNIINGSDLSTHHSYLNNTDWL